MAWPQSHRIISRVVDATIAVLRAGDRTFEGPAQDSVKGPDFPTRGFTVGRE